MFYEYVGVKCMNSENTFMFVTRTLFLKNDLYDISRLGTLKIDYDNWGLTQVLR